MVILFTASTETSLGPTVEINCPVCSATSVDAESTEQIDFLKLFFLIPIFRLRNTFLKCSACGKQLTTKLSIEEISAYSADDLSYYLAGRTSFVGKFLAVACVVLCWAPFINLILGITSILINSHSTGWPKTLSWIGTALSAILMVAVIFLLVISQ